MEESELWVEKYRPKKISSFSGNKKNILLIRKWMNDYVTKSPEFKPILLLVGEPGIGKTTLAQLVLEEYKFNVIEINASKLEGKTDIHRHFDNITKKGIQVIYSSTTKTGVVLDEVDGMAQNETTMNEFLNIIDPEYAKKKKTKTVAKYKKKTAVGFESKLKTTKEEETLTHEDKILQQFDKINKEKEEKFKQFPYRYPIICTANKASDKRMKKLSRRAITVKVEKPTKLIFIKFAQKIIKSESIDITPEAIDLLVERSSYDFRQLISNLQLVSTQDTQITEEDVKGLIRGRDIDQNLFDIVHNIMNNKNSIEDIMLLAETEKRPVSNMIYHNIINIIEMNRSGRRREKVNALSNIMESIADGQKYDRYTYDDNMPFSMVKSIIEPVVISQKLKITNKAYHMESYNIQNYRSQEGKNYFYYISYFIDKFGTFDTKIIFQLCYIIINHLVTININDDITDTKAIKLMQKYNLGDEDINKMCKVCVLVHNIDNIQARIDTAKFKKVIRLALANEQSNTKTKVKKTKKPKK